MYPSIQIQISIILLLVLLLSSSHLSISVESEDKVIPEPWFPLQFIGNLEITSHLIAPDSDYPPQKRRMTIFYDYINKKARSDIEAGYEAAKYFIRRYDMKKEYMIRLPPIDDCKRSYLGEKMPFPEIPITRTQFQNVVEIDGELCNYFIVEEGDDSVRLHLYFTVNQGIPVKLIQERIDKNSGLSIPLLTYEFSDVSLEEPDAQWFELPENYDNNTTTTCMRHIGGFPYLHIFHHFVRF
eukprot:gene5455-6006_t